VSQLAVTCSVVIGIFICASNCFNCEELSQYLVIIAFLISVKLFQLANNESNFSLFIVQAGVGVVTGGTISLNL
jgi:hypothetical protein